MANKFMYNNPEVDGMCDFQRYSQFAGDVLKFPYSIYSRMTMYICSRSPLNGMVPPFHPKKIPFAYYLHHFRATTPQPSTGILFAAFENHILHTYELHAVHVVTYCICMLLFYLVYLCANQSVSIYLLFISCR